MSQPPTTVVVPTLGRPSLRVLLQALADGSEPLTAPVILVDDRACPAVLPPDPPLPVVVVRSGGRGPAAARNLGWRRARTRWVSFLDDDVVPAADWYAVLLHDLAGAAPDVAGSQGRVSVPLPRERRPTDWERSTAGLERAAWITADMSYRRAALAAVGGFDERFRRAFREDTDLALRVGASQGRLVRGARRVLHPVRPVDDWVSIRQQAGNADDFLMARLHGRGWRDRAQAPRGRRRWHVATVGAAGLAALAATAGHRRPAAVAGLAWAAGTADLAWTRIVPGPRDPLEVRRMLLTSAAIPFAATWHAARGLWAHRHAGPWPATPDLVLFDRDGTLVHDVPYNGDPDRVVPVDGARPAVDRLRAAGVRVGVVTNQSGVGTGRLTLRQVSAVNARVEELLGPFDVWQYCPHGPDDGCSCRKPAPGMVERACAALGVHPSRCLVVGDIGADAGAAAAAGGRAILVPTRHTRAVEVAEAEQVCPDLGAAVEQILAGRW